MGHRDTPRIRHERAATLVEYVLLVALVALATLTGIGFLEDGAARATENTAAKISTRTIPTLPPGGGAATTTTMTPPPTTTTPPATTTTRPPSTTTTAPPATTTTVRPPTTTQPSSTTAWGAPATNVEYTWIIPVRWKATVPLTVRNHQSAPMANATVRVNVEVLTSNGWSSVNSLELTSNSSGQVSLDSGMQGYFSATEIRFTIESVTAPGLTWNAANPSITVARP
jgi:Flp pilus assembly pilin Flp